MNDSKNTEDQIELNLSIVREVSEAMTDLPILTRLKFVKSIMFNRDGNMEMLPIDPVAAIATEVLRGVIDFLKQNEKLTNLKTPEP
jgi:hypothetical protein